MSPKNHPDAECSVYVICHKTTDGEFVGPVKVGIAENPGARLYELQTGNPHELVLAAQLLMPARWMARYMERAFHETQAEKRLRGEWFDFLPGQAIAILCIAHGAALHANAPELTPEELEQIREISGINAILADTRFRIKQETVQ